MILTMGYEECWLVGDVLQGRVSGERVHLRFSPVPDDAGERGFDGIDCGPDYLHVEHVGFCGDAGVLKFLNQIVAQRFDLPDRHVRVEFLEPVTNIRKRKEKPADAARVGLLVADPVHFVIPRSLWIEYRAQHAAQMVRRQAPGGYAAPSSGRAA